MIFINVELFFILLFISNIFCNCSNFVVFFVSLRYFYSL